MKKDCKIHEFRGIWVATVYNIDWPTTLNDVKAQKKEFIDILDEIERLNFNAVFVQVRPTSDAFYKSEINPWSAYLTGTQGKYPGYDPLKFMIEEAHKRGIELHAWLNPYRITTSGTDLEKLAENNPARLNPDWVLEHNNALFYNPKNIEVVNYISDTVEEIVANYDVDGIHFDEYFYPYDYPLPKCCCKKLLAIANCRRYAITYMIETVYNTIKSIKPNVKFGISPFGVWKNKSSDITGSNTNALEGYYDLYSDALKWIEDEIVDYIAPQLYWPIEDKDNKYETLVRWWANAVDGTDVTLYIGQNINKPETAREVDEQIEINRKYDEVKGNILFSMRDIQDNNQGVVDQLETAYENKSCT